MKDKNHMIVSIDAEKHLTRSSPDLGLKKKKNTQQSGNRGSIPKAFLYTKNEISETEIREKKPI